MGTLRPEGLGWLDPMLLFQGSSRQGTNHSPGHFQLPKHVPTLPASPQTRPFSLPWCKMVGLHCSEVAASFSWVWCLPDSVEGLLCL